MTKMDRNSVPSGRLEAVGRESYRYDTSNSLIILSVTVNYRWTLINKMKKQIINRNEITPSRKYALKNVINSQKKEETNYIYINDMNPLLNTKAGFQF